MDPDCTPLVYAQFCVLLEEYIRMVVTEVSLTSQKPMRTVVAALTVPSHSCESCSHVKVKV